MVAFLCFQPKEWDMHVKKAGIAALVASGLLAAGCATSRPIETGKNEYTLQSRALTPDGAVEDGIAAANKACGEKNQKARILKLEPVSVFDLYHRRQVWFHCE